MSSYHYEMSLWKEDCTYMSAMGNRRTCCFEEPKGVLVLIGKFYNSDDVSRPVARILGGVVLFQEKVDLFKN